MPGSIFPFADLPLFPPVASAQAGPIDSLYFFLTIVSVIMTVLIFGAIVYFAWKYRRRANVRAVQIEGSTKLELTWSILPFLIMLIMFVWGGELFFAAQSPPKDAMEIFVTGKQWMWKIQYPDGGREIDELHVPANQPVKLTMASEDVIHSFGIPAFRVRHDVIPGHYDSLWFTATKPGRYRFYCTEYCGNQHAAMNGWVNVLDRREYAEWEAGAGSQGTLAEQGEKRFEQLGCSSCHLMDQQGRCPNLRGLYMKPVMLTDGTTVIADDAYIREKILDPNAKVPFGFQDNIMPVFKGQVTEEDIINVIAYIKSLTPNTPESQQGSQQPPIVIAPRADGAAVPANPPVSKPPANPQPQQR